MTYTVKKYLDGLPHFAAVEVRVINDSDEADIQDLCDGDGWIRQGTYEEASKGGYQDWKEAAYSGIKAVLKRAQVTKRVELLKVTGMLTDTNPETVKIAAELATLKCLDINIDLVEKELIESLRGSWKKG